MLSLTKLEVQLKETALSVLPPLVVVQVISEHSTSEAEPTPAKMPTFFPPGPLPPNIPPPPFLPPPPNVSTAPPLIPPPSKFIIIIIIIVIIIIFFLSWSLGVFSFKQSLKTDYTLCISLISFFLKGLPITVPPPGFPPPPSGPPPAIIPTMDR